MSVLACMAISLSAYGVGTGGVDLDVPVQLKAGDKLIDVDIGHAAPLFLDWDGDGLPDLLVGQFGEGKLRIYKNRGTPGHPSFTDFELFQAGGQTGVIPAD